jgi:hypothetical protein
MLARLRAILRQPHNAHRSIASTCLLDGLDDAEIRGFGISIRNIKAFRGQAAAQQFANGGGAARHVTAEAPLIESRKLFFSQHDLKTLATRLHSYLFLSNCRLLNLSRLLILHLFCQLINLG